MPEITAQLVRQLREMSGAGMMECKKALTSTDGDIDAALDELRKAGLKSAAKKVGRETAEGRVGVKVSDDGKTGAIVALATETDFLASTPGFIEFHQALVDHAYDNKPGSVAEMLEQGWSTGGTVQEALTAKIGEMKENLQIVEACAYCNDGGQVAGYVHHDNKKGALVNVTTPRTLPRRATRSSSSACTSSCSAPRLSTSPACRSPTSSARRTSSATA